MVSDGQRPLHCSRSIMMRVMAVACLMLHGCMEGVRVRVHADGIGCGGRRAEDKNGRQRSAVTQPALSATVQ